MEKNWWWTPLVELGWTLSLQARISMFCRPSFQSIDLLQSTPPFSAEEARIQPKTISVGLIRTCSLYIEFCQISWRFPFKVDQWNSPQDLLVGKHVSTSLSAQNSEKIAYLRCTCIVAFAYFISRPDFGRSGLLCQPYVPFSVAAYMYMDIYIYISSGSICTRQDIGSSARSMYSF